MRFKSCYIVYMLQPRTSRKDQPITNPEPPALHLTIALPQMRRPSRRVVIAATASIIIITAALAVGHFLWQPGAIPVIPQATAQRALFPIYVPAWLPRGFTLNPDRYQFKDNALLAYASDPDGNGLAMSEESQASDLDVAGTFGSQLTGATRLTGLPFQTISGSLTNGERILSISTGTTWIIFTFRTNFNDSTLRQLSSHLVQQK